MLQLDDAATIKERPLMTNSDNGQAPELPPPPGPEIRPMEPNERIIRANGVDLCVQTFGDRADPPILLIMGGASSMDWWEDGFCEHLMAGCRFVIRYDHRDTGRSVSYEPGAAPYSLRDLAEDAFGLLDAFGLESAHLVGMSMGGGSASSWR
jgi:pimeloyl-ACP methyl ester carboxylesterase